MDATTTDLARRAETAERTPRTARLPRREENLDDVWMKNHEAWKDNPKENRKQKGTWTVKHGGLLRKENRRRLAEKPRKRTSRVT
jgi:hypothetical protein